VDREAIWTQGVQAHKGWKPMPCTTLATHRWRTLDRVVLSLPDHPRSVPEFQVTNHLPLYLTIVTISRDLFIVMIALVIHLTSGLTRFAPTLLGKLTAMNAFSSFLVQRHPHLGEAVSNQPGQLQVIIRRGVLL